MATPLGLMDQSAEETDTDDGLIVVLTPIQLASILDHVHISPHEMMVNRLWAAGGILFSAAQLAGAAGLLAIPDPTLLTKVGSGMLAVHGFDQGQASIRQLWTGEATEDFTQEAGEAAAREFGVNPEYAHWAGIGLDVAVPIGVSTLLGAVRILSISAGRISLAGEELAGGHTVLKHVGKDDAYLLSRLSDSVNPVKAASTFKSFSVAEQAISDALKAYQAEICIWADSGKGLRFAKDYDAGRTIGRGTINGTSKIANLTKFRFVLKRATQAGKQYFLLTAFPVE